jgi:hypothetical protein
MYKREACEVPINNIIIINRPISRAPGGIYGDSMIRCNFHADSKIFKKFKIWIW